jgi:hypothetical protein
MEGTERLQVPLLAMHQSRYQPNNLDRVTAK